MPIPPERARLSNGEWGVLPWWAKLVTVVGPSGAIVLYLVYMGAQEVPQTRRIVEQIAIEQKLQREAVQDMSAKIEVNRRILQQICANLAKTDVDRNRCFQ